LRYCPKCNTFKTLIDKSLDNQDKETTMTSNSLIDFSKTRNRVRLFLTVLFIFLIVTNSCPLQAQVPKVKPVLPLSQGTDGRLIYTSDERGNRVPDFSYCGYKASEQAIPQVSVQVVVPAKEGDATLRIQSALDYVASLLPDRDGFRGTVLLGKGIHSVEGGLKINASGVVLRGSGMGADGTVLIASGQDRRTLITVSGKNNMTLSAELKISDSYVPVNAVRFRVEKPGNM
jgi:hypothetical protein